MAHFGWTWHYLHEGIEWPTVQRMLADQPSYITDKDKESEHEKMMDKINSIKRG